MNIYIIIISIIIVIIILELILLLIFLPNNKKKINEIQKYNNVLNVKNINDLRKNFVLNNPNGDGSDPT
jgi:hypothetical protein